MQRKDLALGARFGLPLGHQRRLLRLPEVAIWEIFEFPGGLVIYNSYQVQPTTCLKSFFSFVYTYGRILALGPRFGQVLGHQRRLLWFPEVAIWAIFEIPSERSGDINNSTSMPNYCNGPYHDLGVYVKPTSSVWVKVSTATCPSTASIKVPGGRDLGVF